MFEMGHYSGATLGLLVCYFVILLVLSFYGGHRYLMVALYWRYAKGKPDPSPKARFNDQSLPIITVQLPLFNERYVATRLIDAACALDYPADRLEIQVLDDSTDDTTARCAEAIKAHQAKGIDIKLIHRTDRTGYKAGALHEGMLVARGELLAIFDADFVPQPQFLRQVVDHFTDPGVGMVQARWAHINRDFSLLTRAQALFLDGHFVIEHTARNRSGRFFNFNGTAGLWRRQAIEDGGGWQHDTLTEDLDLSYRVQLQGWRFLFLRDVTVPSEIPVEMNAFKAQQHRWAKGSIQTAKKLLSVIFKSEQPWKIKLEAFHHLTANMAYLLMVFLAALMPVATIVRVHQGLYETLIFDLPIFLSATFSVCAFYWVSQREQGRPWHETLLMLPAVLAIGIGISLNNAKAVIEALVGYQTPFVRTPKYAITEGEPQAQQRAEVMSTLRRSLYAKRSTLLTMLELLLGAWFTYAIIEVILSPKASVFSLPFLMLFQLGYFYVAWLSLAQQGAAAPSGVTDSSAEPA